MRGSQNMTLLIYNIIKESGKKKHNIMYNINSLKKNKNKNNEKSKQPAIPSHKLCIMNIS